MGRQGLVPKTFNTSCVVWAMAEVMPSQRAPSSRVFKFGRSFDMIYMAGFKLGQGQESLWVGFMRVIGYSLPGRV